MFNKNSCAQLKYLSSYCNQGLSCFDRVGRADAEQDRDMTHRDQHPTVSKYVLNTQGVAYSDITEKLSYADLTELRVRVQVKMNKRARDEVGDDTCVNDSITRSKDRPPMSPARVSY